MNNADDKTKGEGMQLEINFDAGLTRQYPKFKDLLMVVVYGSRAGLSGVAAACDVSPSLLSRMLKTDDDDDKEQKRNLPIELLPTIIAETGDLRPVYWLVEKFVPSKDELQRAAMDKIVDLLPDFLNLIQTAKGADKNGLAPGIKVSK